VQFRGVRQYEPLDAEGYSSLCLLQDYICSELTLDVQFLCRFTLFSRNNLTSELGEAVFSIQFQFLLVMLNLPYGVF
jgi:hypothetical protein